MDGSHAKETEPSPTRAGGSEKRSARKAFPCRKCMRGSFAGCVIGAKKRSSIGEDGRCIYFAPSVDYMDEFIEGEE